MRCTAHARDTGIQHRMAGITYCSWQTPRTAKQTWCAAAIDWRTLHHETGGATCCHIQAFCKPHNTQQQQMPALTPRDAAACNCANTGRHANFTVPVYTAVSTGTGLHTRFKHCLTYGRLNDMLCHICLCMLHATDQTKICLPAESSALRLYVLDKIHSKTEPP